MKIFDKLRNLSFGIERRKKHVFENVRSMEISWKFSNFFLLLQLFFIGKKKIKYLDEFNLFSQIALKTEIRP